MTQSPLRIFNLVNGKIVEQPVGIPDVECHPHDLLDGAALEKLDVARTGSIANLNDLLNLGKHLNQSGKAFDIVRVGVGDPMSGKTCDQRVYLAPKKQENLIANSFRVTC